MNLTLACSSYRPRRSIVNFSPPACSGCCYAWCEWCGVGDACARKKATPPATRFPAPSSLLGLFECVDHVVRECGELTFWNECSLSPGSDENARDCVGLPAIPRVALNACH